jgi:archaellum biogenesis ATPase FlaH
MMPISSINPGLLTLKAPNYLTRLPGWMIWKMESAPGETKPRKIPYYSSGVRRFGVQGSPKDRARLVSFDDAKRAAAMRGFDGVGFALMPDWHVTALDFDHCVTDGVVDPSVELMVSGTYAELSTSGTGVRAFVLGNLGDRKSHAQANEFGFEVFGTKGFVTFTGQVLPICELSGSDTVIAPPTPELIALHASRFAVQPEYSATHEPIIGLTEVQLMECLRVLDPDMGHNDWLLVGMGLHHETGGDGFDLWDNWSSRGEQYPGREALEKRWLSFGQSGVRPVTARSFARQAARLGADIAVDVARASEFDVLPEPVAPAGGHFKIRSTADFMLNVQPVSWLVKGVLPHAQLGILFGESGSGKSFLAFDLCASMARGIEWNNLKTKQSRVLYVVAEGVGGFHQRVQAYCHQSGLTPSDLAIDIISDVTPNLTDSASVSKLIADIRLCGPYDLVVMDTFAQVTPGANENAGEDMGRALAYCKKISQSSGAMVLLVHHSGKDASKGARGWSGLRGASDVMLEVSRFGDDRCVTVDKQKDGHDGASFGFTLHTVVLGQDTDGDDITSCIVSYGQISEKKRQRTKIKLGDVEKIVLRVAHDLAGLSDTLKIEQTTLIDACVAQIPKSDSTRDRRNFRATRALEMLCAKGLAECSDGVVQILRDTNA